MPGGRVSTSVRAAGSVQSVIASLLEGRPAGQGKEEESLVGFHLKRVG